MPQEPTLYSPVIDTDGEDVSVIFADLILTVIEDAPKAILASLFGTLLIMAFCNFP